MSPGSDGVDVDTDAIAEQLGGADSVESGGGSADTSTDAAASTTDVVGEAVGGPIGSAIQAAGDIDSGGGGSTTEPSPSPPPSTTNGNGGGGSPGSTSRATSSAGSPVRLDGRLSRPARLPSINSRTATTVDRTPGNHRTPTGHRQAPHRQGRTSNRETSVRARGRASRTVGSPTAAGPVVGSHPGGGQARPSKNPVCQPDSGPDSSRPRPSSGATSRSD